MMRPFTQYLIWVEVSAEVFVTLYALLHARWQRYNDDCNGGRASLEEAISAGSFLQREP